MAFDENTFTISGRLTSSVEFTQGPAKFSLAYNARRKDKTTGEWVDDPSFFDVIWWDKEAAEAADLDSGANVTITGRLKQERWETTEGQKRSKVVLVANTVAKVCRKPRVVKSDPDW